jgi:hypothetical protein
VSQAYIPSLLLIVDLSFSLCQNPIPSTEVTLFREQVDLFNATLLNPLQHLQDSHLLSRQASSPTRPSRRNNSIGDESSKGAESRVTKEFSENERQLKQKTVCLSCS